MWMKRPYGQIAKCAEAQAFRKAFPEMASAYTAEEMEGKALNDEREVAAQAPARPEREMYADADFDKNMPKWRDAVEAGKSSPDRIIATVSSKYELTEAQKQAIRDLSIEEASE